MKTNDHTPIPHYRFDTHAQQVSVLIPLRLNTNITYEIHIHDEYYRTVFHIISQSDLVIFKGHGIKDSNIYISTYDTSCGVVRNYSFDVNSLHTIHSAYYSTCTLLKVLEEHYPELKC